MTSLGERENAVLAAYASVLCNLTKKGVPFDLADKVALILERQALIGITYQRTDQEQKLVNQVLPYLTTNS